MPPQAVRGGEVRALVASLLKQRTNLLRLGRGHVSAEALRLPMMRLHTWLQRTNAHVGRESLRAFWTAHEHDVRLVAPATTGGARTIQRIQFLCW